MIKLKNMAEETPAVVLSSPEPESEKAEKFHPEQIGPFATREKLGDQIDKELGSLFILMEKKGAKSEKGKIISRMKDDILNAFDSGLGDQDRIRQFEEGKADFSEEERVRNLPESDLGHDKDHTSAVLLGTIGVCRQILEIAIKDDGSLANPGEIRQILEKNCFSASQPEEKEQSISRLATALESAGSPEEIKGLVENLLAAAICHDVGYMNRAGEKLPHGGCFALLHEERSAEFAQVYLQDLWDAEEIAKVEALIRGTKTTANYERDYSNPLLREGARFLHLADVGAYFCSHDRDTISGNEEVPLVMLKLYRDFAFPQVVTTGELDKKYLTVDGIPGEDSAFGWDLSKNETIFGSSPLHFSISDYAANYRKEMERFFGFLDRPGQENLFRQGYENTLARQQALKNLLHFPEFSQAEKAPKQLADFTYFEGMIDAKLWTDTLKECVIADQPLLSEDKEEKQESLKIRFRTSGLEVDSKEVSLENLIKRLPTEIIKEKLVEIASRFGEDKEAWEGQKQLLKILFKNSALIAFREGISHLEVRFAINAYTQDLEKELGPKALSWEMAAEAAFSGLKEAEGIARKQGFEVAPNEKAEACLIALIRHEKDLDNPAKTVEDLKSLKVISGVSIGGTEEGLLANREKVLEFAQAVHGDGLPLECHLGQGYLGDIEIEEYQKFAKELAGVADRVVTGAMLYKLGLDQQKKPLILAPFSWEHLGVSLGRTYDMLAELYQQERHPDFLLASAHGGVDVPVCNVIQLVMFFEKVTGRRIEKVFSSAESEKQDEALKDFVACLQKMTPNFSKDLFGAIGERSTSK